MEHHSKWHGSRDQVFFVSKSHWLGDVWVMNIILLQRRTIVTPCWSYFFSSNLYALLPVLSEAGSALLLCQSKRMLHVAWNIHNSPFLVFCFPRLNIKAQFTIHMIKSFRTENNFVFEGRHDVTGALWLETSTWTAARTKDYTSPPGCGQHQEVCNNELHLLSF